MFFQVQIKLCAGYWGLHTEFEFIKTYFVNNGLIKSLIEYKMNSNQ